MKELTRAQAQRLIANTNEVAQIRSLLKHPNKHIQVYAAHKLDKLENNGTGLASAKAMVFLLNLIQQDRLEILQHPDLQAALQKAKRSEASRKAAATRKRKKAEQAENIL